MTTNMAVRKSDWLMKIEIQGSVLPLVMPFSKIVNITSAEWNKALSSLNKNYSWKSLIFTEIMKKYLYVCVCTNILV